jgi:hypothetical protein
MTFVVVFKSGHQEEKKYQVHAFRIMGTKYASTIAAEEHAQ